MRAPFETLEQSGRVLPREAQQPEVSERHRLCEHAVQRAVERLKPKVGALHTLAYVRQIRIGPERGSVPVASPYG